MYSAFDFNFYSDKNFTDIWNKSDENSKFNVQKFGSIGVSTDARVSISIDNTIPKTLYYRLDPVFESDLPQEKDSAIVDLDVVSGSEIEVKESKYNGRYTISTVSPTAFTYNLEESPEAVSYASSISKISYKTNCTHAYGPISKVDIKNSGGNYFSLPGISTINSTYGINAVIEASSSTIGKIKKTKIKDC